MFWYFFLIGTNLVCIIVQITNVLKEGSKLFIFLKWYLTTLCWPPPTSTFVVILLYFLTIFVLQQIQNIEF